MNNLLPVLILNEVIILPNQEIKIDLNNEFSKRTRNSLKNIVSPKQDLTFSQLKVYYMEKGKY